MATDNLVLEMLRAIRAKQDQQDEKLGEIVARLSSLDRLMAGVFIDKADQNDRYDRMLQRIERIEKRLDIVES